MLINVPAAWDDRYFENLRDEVFEFIENMPYTLNDRELLGLIMRETRGTVNPNQIEGIIKQYHEVS